MQIQTKTGMVQGISEDGCLVYKGIPYAEPPMGERRFRPPVPKAPWDGVLVADQFQAIAPQRIPDGTAPWDKLYYKEFYEDPAYLRPQSEDCLYLNIWTPEDAAGKRLPVAFYIHGGAFSGGYSSEITFTGASYAQKDVILVTIDYRLGILGFLASPLLDAENERGVSGNYGILDQIEALRWVHENIGAFGGDPDNITVFGQSAGSMSTQVLVSSPLTEGLIAKAVFQSGISCEGTILYTPTLAESEETPGKTFTELAGARTAADLRALPVDRLLKLQEEAAGKLMSLGKGVMFVPAADGWVLPAPVPELWKEGKMRDIPYLAGCVADDLGSTPEEIAEKKPGLLHRENLLWSQKTEETFGRPAYVYFFKHALPGDEAGAFHSSELWYMLGSYRRWWRPTEPADTALSAEMVDQWTCFMRTGAPTADGSWRPCTAADPFVKEFA